MLPSMMRQTLCEFEKECRDEVAVSIVERAGFARGVECLGGSVGLSGFDASSSLRGASL